MAILAPVIIKRLKEEPQNSLLLIQTLPTAPNCYVLVYRHGKCATSTNTEQREESIANRKILHVYMDLHRSSTAK